MRRVSLYIIVAAFIALFAFAILIKPAPARPDIRIIDRVHYDAVYGPCYELQWSVNGEMQNPAYFSTEEKRTRYEEYLATVGRVTE